MTAPKRKRTPQREPSVCVSEIPMEDAPVLASRHDQYGRAMPPVYRGELTGSAAVREAVDAVRAVHKTAVLVNGISYVFCRRTWYRVNRPIGFRPALPKEAPHA